MTSFFFTRKFNRFDIIWISCAVAFASQGHWLAWATVILGGAILSTAGEMNLERSA